MKYMTLGIKEIDSNFEKISITSPQQAADYCRKFYYDDINIFESMFGLLLNRANETVGWFKISQGGVCGTVCDVKIVSKYVVDTLASGLIIVHNHPSGNTRPSDNDKSVVNKIKDAVKMFDCELIDSIILGLDNNYYSFIENGEYLY